MQRIYLDACAINRLRDDPSDPRVYEESHAIEQILNKISRGELELLSSDVLAFEINANPAPIRRQDAFEVLAYAHQTFSVLQLESQRGVELHGFGYGSFDALHIACAEAMLADFLITTDDRFLKLANRGVGNPQVKLKNPIDWLKERAIV